MIKNLQCIVFCGGKGTRLGNLTKKLPKPLLKVNKFPIVNLIIRHYVKFNIKKFILLVGYKNSKFLEELSKKALKKKFINKNLTELTIKVNKKVISVKILNTGVKSQKKKRLLSARKYILENEFFLTYGDGLSNVNIKKQYIFFKKNKKIGLITTVNPPSRFGEVKLKGDLITNFSEKPNMSSGYINGGFMILSSKIFNLINIKKKGDFEETVLSNLSKKKQILSFKHLKFWQCIDNERELIYMNSYVKKTKSLKKFYGI